MLPTVSRPLLRELSGAAWYKRLAGVRWYGIEAAEVGKRARWGREWGGNTRLPMPTPPSPGVPPTESATQRTT